MTYLALFLASYAAILLAVQTIGWGLVEMSAGFIGIAIAISLISGMSGEESMHAFVRGLKTMIVPALVDGVACGISVMRQEGMQNRNGEAVSIGCAETVAADRFVVALKALQ